MTSLLVALLLAVVPSVQAQPVPVSVGGYIFPPFVNPPSAGKWSGLTLDLIDALNNLQDEYEFVFYPTSASRRFHDFDRGHYDLVLFESPHWGWQQMPVASLHSPLVGREVVIAKALPGRGQKYFSNREGKRIALFSGYHYAFAGFNPDRDYLRRHHNAVMTFSHESNIQMVLRGRAELSVVGETFLHQYLAKHPGLGEQLLISEEPDQEYRHALIVRRGAAPGIAYLSKLFEQLQNTGELTALLARHAVVSDD